MEKELDLYALWQVVAKRWIMIVIIPVVAALGSYLYITQTVTPLYTASTTMIVMRPTEYADIYSQDIWTSRQLVDTYSDIMRSRRIMEAAAAREDWPYEDGRIGAMISVEGVGDTEIMRLSATDPDPEVARDVANVVAATFQEEILEIMNVENVSILDKAVTPGGPISPRPQRDAMVAFMVGLMGAFGLAFLLEYMDRTIKDSLEVQNRLQMPVLGLVPAVEGDKLFVLNDPRSPQAEAFRTLRTNIQYSSIDRKIKKILVTGANPACGKSTIASNLALSLAQSGDSVLLVDADLRRPYLHRFFQVKNDQGLTNLIFDEKQDQAAVMQKTAYENLTVLPSGPIPPYPAEMLDSNRMKNLVGHFALQYDYLVIDSPPVIAVTDAAILSGLVDGVLFVLDYGRVKWEEAEAALGQMGKVHANLIGAVLNAMPKSKSYYNGYQYYYGARDTSQNKKGRRPGKKRKG